MAGIAQDIRDSLSQLVALRLDHERAWRKIKDYAAPDAGDFSLGASALTVMDRGTTRSAEVARSSQKRYDSTAVNAVDRFASGLISLIIPQSEYWHDMGLLDLDAEDVELDLEERRFFERVRNFQFKVRYNARSGWVKASQLAFRRSVAFGNAFVWTEEGKRDQPPIMYKHMPLPECYIDEDAFGNVNVFYRFYSLTAKQAVEEFKGRVSEGILKASNNPNEANRKFAFVHAVRPRADFGMTDVTVGVRGSKFQSIHIEYENGFINKESGFFEFPVTDFRWLPEQGKVWAEGPVQRVLSDILGLNLMAKHELVAFEQSVQPALLVANAGIMNRPNANPRKIIHGGLSPTGAELVKPLMTGQRLDFGALVKEAKKNQVNESLYINLFQILVQNPQMSATEALIRANEKGELLGPAGAGYQNSLSHLVDREQGILTRKGLYDEDGPFRVPESLQGAEPGPQFQGPLNRARQAKEVEGTLNFLQVIRPLAEIDPRVRHKINPSSTADGLADRMGVPTGFLNDDDTFQQLVAQEEEQQQLLLQAQAARESAAAGKDTAQALQLLGDQ